jgi:CRISPR-associated endonuclease/helicase Cas3
LSFFRGNNDCIILKEEGEAMAFLAHSQNQYGKTDTLLRHLNAVADRAAEYGKALGIAEEARLAGLLHDMGKFGELFQRRLQGKESGIDHWSAGAWEALNLQKNNGVASAVAIHGHHIGLHQSSGDALRGLNPLDLRKSHPLGLRLSDPDIENLYRKMLSDGLILPPSSAKDTTVYSGLNGKCAAAMLDIRMLFSTLVDADFLETEAHFQGSPDGNPVYREKAIALEPDQALTHLQSYLIGLTAESKASPEVNSIRGDLLESCLKAAALPLGTFTLTAPTGTGKTLSMLAFALKHASIHKLSRIILVIPYLNIIEQTVLEYRKVFSDYLSVGALSQYILEHHSLAGSRGKATVEINGTDMEEDIQYRRRSATENWDAPIIVTTSVQFLESLFSNRPSDCRKLHRLAGSVILFDEVQTLPGTLAIPTLATLSRLVERYTSSLVFATATQPAFGHLDQFVQGYCTDGWKPKEIVPGNLNLFSRAKRVTLNWDKTDKPVSWEALGAEIVNLPQVLCIVNLKRHALSLFEQIKKMKHEGVFHLSTNMCPAHRQTTLNTVRHLLKQGKPCCLVATQCVEAGVDVDFPVVYRAFGPLDSIAQAAGRCNRNGNNHQGDVRIFIPESENSKRLYPDSSYAQAASVTNLLLTRRGKEGMDINNLELFNEYYRVLYTLSGVGKDETELVRALRTQDFVRVADLYRIIDEDTINVMVPYELPHYEGLRDEARRTGLSRQWVASARPYTISLFRPKNKDPLWSYLEPVMVTKGHGADDWFIYSGINHYDPDKGLVLQDTSNCLIA